MIKHIVMFQLKERNENSIAELIQKLNTLKNQIPEIIELETGQNFATGERAMDVILSTSFQNKQALEHYRTHPHHLPVLEYVREVCQMTKVVDYEVETSQHDD